MPVIKNKKKGKLTGLETGDSGQEQEILDIIQSKGRGKTMKTSYVESRNGNYRKDNSVAERPMPPKRSISMMPD